MNSAADAWLAAQKQAEDFCATHPIGERVSRKWAEEEGQIGAEIRKALARRGHEITWRGDCYRVTKIRKDQAED